MRRLRMAALAGLAALATAVAAPALDASLTGGAMSPARAEAAAAHPFSAPGAPVPDGATSYSYVDGYEYAPASGATVRLSQDDPHLATNADHSLVELAVESADGREVVEVGWVVAAGAGRPRPRLFVYHWVNGLGTCYNGCGWVSLSHRFQPGMVVAAGIDAEYGVGYRDQRWWVTYDGQRIGYFPSSLWGGRFRQAGLVQVFGEVAAASPVTCTQMGDGISPSRSGAAEVSDFTLQGSPATGLLALAASTPSAWGGRSVSPTSFRLGGPGVCDSLDGPGADGRHAVAVGGPAGVTPAA